jgi:hypothetical protein
LCVSERVFDCGTHASAVSYNLVQCLLLLADESTARVSQGAELLASALVFIGAQPWMKKLEPSWCASVAVAMGRRSTAAAVVSMLVAARVAAVDAAVACVLCQPP